MTVKANDRQAEPEATARVRAALEARGWTGEILGFPEGTASAADAAAAIGCALAQIAKTIVFRSEDGPVLVVASGTNRVDRAKAEAALGRKLRGAGAEWVLEHTGFPAGGVAPVGHASPPPALIDEDLARFEVVWAAAGSPMHVFRTSAGELVRLTGGRLAEVRQAP
ncbi:MAG TPA: YbaK/EbsC family protein [Caulobacteraceae bacterium]